MLIMLRKPRTPSTLFSGFNTLQFASVMGLVVFVVLIIFMVAPTHPHHGLGPDLPQVLHPVVMPGAARDDAMKVTITRDGKIYFGSEQIDSGNLSAKIQERLEDREVERKVYLVADARSRWGSVEVALDGVGSAGIVSVAFMAEKRRTPLFSH